MTKAAGERRSGVANDNRMGGGIRNPCGRPIGGVVPIVGGIAGPGKCLAEGMGGNAQVNYD